MYGLSDYTIQTLNEIFKKYHGIQKVMLYGSRAKGNYKVGSDIDIAVRADNTFQYNDLLRISRDFDDSDMPYFVDVSIYDKLENAELKKHIDRIGKVLYDSASLKN
jgi:predicted nucleotidyltransferase